MDSKVGHIWGVERGIIILDGVHKWDGRGGGYGMTIASLSVG